jgi:membrane associated rhomboid family serine protease
MDWSLALASQGIAAIIKHDDIGWALIVEGAEFERAKAVLAQYQIENRGWRWRGEMPGSGVVFHWGALVWVLAMVGVYYWSTVRFPQLRAAGMVDSPKVAGGQWWRLFTAISLHENLPHLIGNVTTGFLLLGVAMGRFGPGVAMLAAFLAGAAGNYASVLLDRAHESLGASGMVTGALGLITMQTFSPRRKYHNTTPLLPRALAAGVLVLVLIGFSPGTDMVAHVAGFLGGVLLGLALGWVRPEALQRAAPNIIASLVLGTLALGTWWLACGE